jgi:hypothetical protein
MNHVEVEIHEGKDHGLPSEAAYFLGAYRRPGTVQHLLRGAAEEFQ